MAYAQIRPRRGTLYEWSSVNPILAEGELAIELPETGVGTGLCKFKLGDGVNKYNDLSYAFDSEAASAIYGGGVTEYNNIYIRTGTEEDWLAEDPILGNGEIVYVTGVGIKVGDGETKFSELEYISGDGNGSGSFDWDFCNMDNASDYDDEDDFIYDFNQ